MKLLMKALTHLGVLLVFFVVSGVYFSPAFNGYDLNQGDISRFKGMSKELSDYRDANDDQSLWTNSMFSGMPAYQISVSAENNIAAKVISAVRSIFPGPVGIVWLAMVCFYILCLCLRINPWIAMIASIAFGLASFNILFLGAGHASKVVAVAIMPAVLGGVILCFRGSWLAGLAVAGFFGALQLAANHPQMSYYLVIMLGCVAIGEGIRLVLEKDFKKLGMAFGALAIAGVLSLLPNITGLISTYNYSKNSTRGQSELTVLLDEGATQSKEGLGEKYILEYSLSRGEFWSVLVPNVKGGASGYLGSVEGALDDVPRELKEQVAQSPSYWGDQNFTGGAFYYGALVIALFLLGMFFLKDKVKWPLFVVSLLAVFLSWKDPSAITHFFLDSVPFFDKFRDTKMMMVLLQITAPLVAALTLNQILKEPLEKGKSLWFYIGSGAGVFILLNFLLMPGVYFEFFGAAEQTQFKEYLQQYGSDPAQKGMILSMIDAIKGARMGIMKADVMRSLLFVLIGMGVVFAFAMRKLKAVPALIVIGLLVTVDLWTVDRRYLDTEKPQKSRHWVKASDYDYPFEALAADQSIFTIESQAVELEPALSNRLAIAKEKKGGKLTKKDVKMKQAAEFAALNESSNYRVLNIGNAFADARTSYFHKSIGGYHGAKLKAYQELIDFQLNPEIQAFMSVVNEKGLDTALAAMPVLNMLNTKYIIGDPNSPAIPNSKAMGNAWFVNRIAPVPTADDELLGLAEADLKTQAIVNKKFMNGVQDVYGVQPQDEIEMTSYAPNELVYSSKASGERFAVFSEIYYPEGWEVSIDDEPVEMKRANYVLRALIVPAGEHTIRFTYNPAAYNTGKTVSLVGSILLLILLLGAGYVRAKDEISIA